jgi:hypothetical protein
VAIPRRISDIKPLVTNLAQTSHYEVKFGGLPPELRSYLLGRGISSRFIAEDAGLLCNSASLPTTQLATVDIAGNYMGITETFAHRRQYQDITLEFYVDKNYRTLKFLEHWMEFVASGSTNPINGNNLPINRNVDEGYFIRMQYPKYYKSNRTRIIKFDRDYQREIEYTFIGLYPYSISSIPVAYASSDIMKMSATFKMDRYVIGKSYSLDVFEQRDNERDSSQPVPQPPSEPKPLLVPRSAGSLPSNGVELKPAGQTLYESLYGTRLREIRERRSI